MKRNFLFIEEMPFSKKAFLSSFLGLSLYLIIFGGHLISYVLFGIALRYLMQKGVELNLLDMRYRELYSWYGIRFGKWQNLPKIDYVSIFRTKKKSRVRGIGANETNISSEIFKLNLFHNRNKHITLLESENENKVLDIGDNISKILDVKFHKAN